MKQNIATITLYFEDKNIYEIKEDVVLEKEAYMTAEEVNRKYHISVDKIRYYEENGLLEHNILPDGKVEYTEAQIHCAGMIHSLLEAGMDVEKIKTFMKLFYENKSDKSGQVQILRKQRFLLLDEIHKKQQSLDELDYMIGELKKGGAVG